MVVTKGRLIVFPVRGLTSGGLDRDGEDGSRWVGGTCHEAPTTSPSSLQTKEEEEEGRGLSRRGPDVDPVRGEPKGTGACMEVAPWLVRPDSSWMNGQRKDSRECPGPI